MIVNVLGYPAICVIIIIFLCILTYFVFNVRKIKKSISYLTEFLKTIKKSELNYRFKEIDETFSSNDYIANYWIEFKNTLVFADNLALKTQEGQFRFDNISQKITGIQCTTDPEYFFNEETLIYNKINYKFISITPTILTGLGPLFTFLNIAVAFSCVNFSSQESTLLSIGHLMSSMKIAALASVVAVGSSILFIIVERILYNNMCKKPLQDFQRELNKLFDNISSENFLIELLKEAKIQNYSVTNLLNSMPNQIKAAFDSSLSTNLVPYLENLIFTLNKLQESNKDSSNFINDLFKNSD